MCPNCRAFITMDDRVCPYCDVRLGPRIIDQRIPDDLLGGLIPGARFLTMLILIINSGLYVATIVASLNAGNQSALSDIDGRTLYSFGAKFSPAVFGAQEYWRLITAGFLHAGLLHFLMNTWVLFDLGANTEQAYGASRMVVIYFVSTLLGFLLSTYWSATLSVGASAGIYGLLGAMIAFGMHSRSMMGQMIKTHYSRWAIYGLLIGILGFFPIDNAAHVGGLIGGFGIAWIMGLPVPGNPRERIWDYAAALCALITALAFVQMLLALTSPASS